MKWSHYLSDESATVNLGRSLGHLVVDGAIIYLEGTLGAGKTTLCRGVLAAFGYSGSVKSPTYTLVEPYELNGTNLFHFDLYRLGEPEELEYMGIRDYFEGGSVALIEWPVKGRGYIPQADLTLTLTPRDEGRELNIETETERGVAILSLLKEKEL